MFEKEPFLGRASSLHPPIGFADAVADLGKTEDIRQVFAGFQKHLYEEPLAA